MKPRDALRPSATLVGVAWLLLSLEQGSGLSTAASFKPMTKFRPSPTLRLQIISDGLGRLVEALRTYDKDCSLPRGCNETKIMMRRIAHTFEWSVLDATKGPRVGKAGWQAIDTYLAMMPQLAVLSAELTSKITFDDMWNALDKNRDGEVSTLKSFEGTAAEQVARRAEVEESTLHFSFAPEQLAYVFKVADLDNSSALSYEELFDYVHAWSAIGLIKFREHIDNWIPTCNVTRGCNETAKVLRRMANKLEWAISDASAGHMPGHIANKCFYGVVPMLAKFYLNICYIEPFRHVWKVLPKNKWAEIGKAEFMDPTNTAAVKLQKQGLKNEMVDFMIEMADLDGSGSLRRTEFIDFIHAATQMISIQPQDWNPGIVSCWAGVFYKLDPHCPDPFSENMWPRGVAWDPVKGTR